MNQVPVTALSKITAAPKGMECRFAVHAKANDGTQDDLHLVKLQVHHEDGTVEPVIRLLENWERPFWITKKGFQNHEDKKEWEKIERLNRYKSTQSQLVRNMARALGTPWFQGSQKDLQQSPYIYGSDILSTALIKQIYREKYASFNTPYTNAVFDTETDVLNGTGQIMMATISFKTRVFTAVQKSFVEGYTDVVPRIKELAQEILGHVIAERGIELEIMLVDSEIDVVRATMQKAHAWRPDWLSVWNLEFDMEKVIAACERAGVAVEDLLSDPQVPAKYRSFRFKKGAAQKVTASGRKMSFKPSQRWHTVFCPSSFYWVDAMCAYRQIRTGKQEEPSYSLDAILKKHLKITKLKFEVAEKYSGLKWHQFMQKEYPLHYVVYNIFDCVSMEMLDEKTKDLQLSMPMFAKSSDFQHFNSQPRRTVDDLHHFALQKNLVIASTAKEMADEFDSDTLDLSGWIVMLPSHLVADNGLKLIIENPDLSTNIRAHVADLDVAGSYPNGECAFNISKATTKRELVQFHGVPEQIGRMATINLSAGHVNAVEFCTNLYGMPTMDQWLEAFLRDHPDAAARQMRLH